MKFAWDKGLKYDEAKRMLLDIIDKLRNKANKRRFRRDLLYAIVLLMQLRNGSRILEAVNAVKNFAENNYVREGNRYITKVRVLKKKKEEYRELIYPEFLAFKILRELIEYQDIRELLNNPIKLKWRIQKFSERHLKVNTHSLRYARITYLQEKGVNPALIAKITKHSKLDFILTYTQEKLAKKINMEYY